MTPHPNSSQATLLTDFHHLLDPVASSPSPCRRFALSLKRWRRDRALQATQDAADKHELAMYRNVKYGPRKHVCAWPRHWKWGEKVRRAFGVDKKGACAVEYTYF